MRRSAEIASRSLLALAVVGLLVAALAGLAHGERRQYGSLIVSLDGGISPRRLPRERPVPVAVDLEGALRTTDGSLLPRVVKVELALPGQGVISTRGLPVCPRKRLRGTDSVKALAICRPALVGQGQIEADVHLPNQRPFRIRARLLIFNGRLAGGRQALLLHAFTARPPIWVVLPFVVEHRRGWLGTVLIATPPNSVGPWPHFARFEMRLSRRYSYRGRSHSFLSGSCPIPPRFTAGFFPFTEVTYTLAGGRRVGTEITRGCRAG